MAEAADRSVHQEPPLLGVQAQTEIRTEGYETDCWGCGQHLHLAVFTSIFRCAWCGAITVLQPYAKRRSKWKLKLAILRDRFLVLAVLILIASIVCGGVWATFPVIFSQVSFGFCLHSLITCALVFNVLFNYILAAFRPAGAPPEIAWGKVGDVIPGSLEGHRYCVPCAKPKPPRVHHCSTCAGCVVDMDHHCPFIGNCVGAGNHRHFLLFLFYTCLSVVYVFLLALYGGMQVWPTVISFYDEPFGEGISWKRGGAVLAGILRALVRSQIEVSIRALGLIYLEIASLSILVGVGALLYQQISMLYSGNGYIDSVQAWPPGVGRGVTVTRGFAHLKKVFGSEHPVFWIIPRLQSHPESQSRKFHVI